MSFLRSLLNALLPERATHASSAQQTLEEVGPHLAPTILTIASGTVTVLLPYREASVRSLIVEAKFHETSKAFSILGRLLAEYLTTLSEESAFETKEYVLIPIPLSKQRMRERGYNQTERITREALRFLPLHFSINTALLSRVRDTKPQTSLARKARLQNMLGAFAVAQAPTETVTYILLDDVMTTGATLSVAHFALGEAGVHTTIIVALAH